MKQLNDQLLKQLELCTGSTLAVSAAPSGKSAFAEGAFSVSELLKPDTFSFMSLERLRLWSFASFNDSLVKDFKKHFDETALNSGKNELDQEQA